MNLDRILNICGKILRALAALCKYIVFLLAIMALICIPAIWLGASPEDIAFKELPLDMSMYALLTILTLGLILLPSWFYVWSRIYEDGGRICTIFRESRSHGLTGLSPILIDLQKMFLYSFAFDVGFRLISLPLMPWSEMQDAPPWQVSFLFENMDLFLPGLAGSSALLAAFFCYLWARVLEQYNSMEAELETVV
jgi:hypothetical protein